MTSDEISSKRREMIATINRHIKEGNTGAILKADLDTLNAMFITEIAYQLAVMNESLKKITNKITGGETDWERAGRGKMI
jgi:hypothetical protein